MNDEEIKSAGGHTLLANGIDSKDAAGPDLEVTIKSVVPKIGFPSCRHILVAMGFLAFINVYCLRVNLSVAIVDMVDNEYLHKINTEHLDTDNSTSAVVEQVCESTPVNQTYVNLTENGVFQWDAKKQGVILASFFYGYTTTQIIGGTLAQRFGGKILLLGGIFWTALLTLLTPVLTTYGGYIAIVAVRVLEGIGEGVTFPATHAMLSKWAPPLERSTMATAIYAGSTMGTVIAMPISGFLCKYFGWESVFYVFGVFGVIWSVMWFFLVYNSPATHPRISKEEREYIETAVGQKVNNKGNFHVPWCSIATSLPVYALAITHVCNNFGYYTLLTCLPLYLKHILLFDIKSNGILSGLPYFFMWVFITLSGRVSDVLRSKKILSTTNVRKISIAIGFLVPGACLVATGYVDCNAPLAVTLIVIAVGVSGMSFAGWSVNHLDLAPVYAGSLMGITNTLATMPGFIGPSIVGAITYRNQTRAAWRTIFFITAGIYLFGTIVFCLFGSGDVQPWAKDSTLDIEELEVINDSKSTEDKQNEKKKEEKQL